ncbi:MAG: MaoC family dehydratase N-terminal domain-containing protein [Acidimicrobiales bacterium]|nr:MaoC family dehydratase N-terminal domain-containing protein [Acidimicrobiales bacterium]MDG1846741.1 MaoC family dehydratase N-terminal domain-containing protein [Acidimicrobiales bacterium]
MDLEALEALVGYELPVGQYCITAEDHKKTLGAIHQEGYAFEVAHPVYAHLAPHCGMGLTIDKFFDFVDFPMDGGALYGEGDLTYHKPIRIGVTYTVRGLIASVERKQGARTGTFDLITLHLELVDSGNEPVVTSLETYVFPRSETPTS